jgi:hypothetical protein
MKTKRLRGGQSTGAESLFEIFFKYVMIPVIFIGIIYNFVTGNAGSGGALLFLTLFFIFILYLTTLGADYIKNPNGNTVIKAILGVLMIYNTGAIFVSTIGVLIIFLIALTGILSAIF